MKTENLFGEMVEVVSKKKILSVYQLRKRSMNYRKSETGDKCKFCFNGTRWRHHDKIYFKCELIGHSHSSATDIRAGHVCDKFIREDNP